MNKIDFGPAGREKQHIPGETSDELKHLKQEIAKPTQEKPGEKLQHTPEITHPSEKAQIRESVTKGEQKEAEKTLVENLETVFHEENINKAPEKRSEQISASKAAKGGHLKSPSVSTLNVHLPSDAPLAANQNRIREANAPLHAMLEAKGIAGRIFKKLFGFKESDKIPEHAA